MTCPESRSFMILIHRRFQFLKPGCLWLKETEMFNKFQSFYHNPLRQSRGKYKDHHESNAENIQAYAQVKHPHVLTKISFQKASAKNPDYNSDHYQNRFISNRDNHQDQRSDRNRKFVLFHKINLHWLSAGCRRCDTAEKESHKRIQSTMPHLYFCSESPHHIEDNYRLAKYEQYHTNHADQ